MNHRVASISTDQPSAVIRDSSSPGSYITLMTLNRDPSLRVRRCRSVPYSTTYGSFANESGTGSSRLSIRNTRPEAVKHERTRDQNSPNRDRGTCESQKEKNTTSYDVSGRHSNTSERSKRTSRRPTRSR